MPTFGTVCDGIGCGHLGFVQVGFACAWSFEIEPFPSAVLAYRFPEVTNHGDMLKCAGMVKAGEIEAPDVFIGGTPCQAFSVAGKRKGLEDARGNLSLTFCGIVDAIDDVRERDGKLPCAVLWENVPGVLSDKGNAFGCFLGELSGAGCQLVPPGEKWRNAGCVFGPKRTVAWRVLDSQFFGVAQRRRRVFVVASAGDGFRPEEVLFEREGVRRDSAPSREAGQVAPTIPARSTAGGGLGTDFDCDGGVVQVCPTLRPAKQWPAEVSSTLDTTFGTKQGLEDQHVNAGCPLFVPVTSHTLRGEGFQGTDEACGGYVQPVSAFCIKGAAIGRKPEAGPQYGEVLEDICYTQNCVEQHAVAYTLRGDGFDAREDGTGRGTPLAATYDMRGNGDGVTVGTLTGDHAGRPTDYTPVVCLGGDKSWNGKGWNDGQTVGTLSAQPGMKQQSYIATPMQVRRLTPRECERLQGLPDDFTLIPWRGKPAADCPDGPRYKGIGNGQTVNVMRWLAERIKKAIAV